jgi:hypothetical protein
LKWYDIERLQKSFIFFLRNVTWPWLKYDLR